MLAIALRSIHNSQLRGVRYISSYLAGHIAENCQKFSHKTALVSTAEGAKWSYADLKKQVDAVANGLEEMGVAKGSPVIVSLPNNLESLVTRLAAATIGAQVIDIPLSASREEAKDILTASFAPVAVVDAAGEALSFVQESGWNAQGSQLGCEALPQLRKVVHTGQLFVDGTERFQDILVYRRRHAENDCSSALVAEGVTQAQVMAVAETVQKKLSPGSRVALYGDHLDVKTALGGLMGAVGAGCTIVTSPDKVDAALSSFEQQQCDSAIFGAVEVCCQVLTCVIESHYVRVVGHSEV
mmetsp:Transcript_46342/g.119601  ORF Transcript_46342/g.119601 Transcript_46342/m.119601 type:complete len:298 (-) Transcript_46342:241-1134(-)